MIFPKQLMSISELTEMGFSRYELNTFMPEDVRSSYHPVVENTRLTQRNFQSGCGNTIKDQG